MPDRRWKSRIEKALTNLVLILLVAFAARFAFAANQVSKIPASVLTAASFDQETGSIASSLATGKGFSNPFNRETGPTAWLTPVYPLLVAGSFKIFGLGSLHSFYWLVFLNIVFSAGVCVPVFFVGKRVAGLAAGSLAAWLWALFPSAIMVPFEWIWDTSLAALLAALLLWATLEVADSARWRDWCGYGLLWGFTLMTNPAIGALLPFHLAWATYRARQQNALFSTTALRKPGLALLLAVVCCVPWTIRNYSVFHRFIPLRSNFPFELYIGNNENYVSDHPRYPPPITKEREIVRYIHMGEIPFMHEEMRKAKLFLQEHPRRVLFLFGDRFAAFWTGAPFALQNFLATDSYLVRTVLLCSTLSALGALAGIVVLFWRGSPFAFPLAAYPVVFPFTYYITHTSLRYRHPIDPVVLLLTAIASVSVYHRFSRHPVPDTEATSVAALT
jgi:Dolichyl-phosphate-mannose-protein mannosyltransferase